MALELHNQLASTPSPYLRAHKDNPVAWQEWTPSTLALAQTHQRMIFLSVGYNACHWCHVMEKESFSSPEIAHVLNDNFIPIKLDRESRPDLDEIYMNFVTATTGRGGWPLNVFLTPDMKPIFGGTYWPGPGASDSNPNPTAVESEDKPLTFLDILHKMIHVWNTERSKCLLSANDMTSQLQEFALEGNYRSTQPNSPAGFNDPEPLDLDLLDDALDHFTAKYDKINGGFSDSPKFPMPVNLRFLLRLGASIGADSGGDTHTRFGFPSPIPSILGRNACTKAASMAHNTLVAISRSALRDHLGHGFHRYSVTPDWNLPHFEKMLYDNAELLAAYCDAWALSRNAEILGTIYDLVDYLTDLSSPIVRKEGGWYSSEDADSYPTLNTSDEKKEGAFYVWTMKELENVLGETDAPILASHFGIKADGNVPAKYDVHDELLNQNTIFVKSTPSSLAREFKLKESEVISIIKSGRIKLSEYRSAQRSKPGVDDKVITSWNGLAINALARASATLAPIDTDRAQRCRDGAIRGLTFIQSDLFNPTTGKLTRVKDSRTKDGDADYDLAFIDDYANIIKASISLYDLTLDYQWLDFAFTLQATLDQNFRTSSSAGYLQAAKSPSNSTSTSTSGPPTPDQILRLKPGMDNTTPSPNGMIATNLLYLSSYARTAPYLSSNPSLSKTLENQAKGIIDAFAVEALQHPFLYVTLLGGVVMESLGVKGLLVPDDMSLEEVSRRGLRGFSRTVVRGGKMSMGGGGDGGEVMICGRDGTCRVMIQRDLDGEASDSED